MKWSNAIESRPKGCFQCLCYVRGNAQGMGAGFELLCYDGTTKKWYINDVPGNCAPGFAKELDDWHSVEKWIPLYIITEKITGLTD